MLALLLGRRWVNPHTNYDNVGIAMLTLFQVASLELWVDIMFMWVAVCRFALQVR